MTATTPEDNNNFQAINVRLDSVDQELRELNQRLQQSNDRMEIYQKASNQVVNLAFALIATAVIAIVVPALLH